MRSSPAQPTHALFPNRRILHKPALTFFLLKREGYIFEKGPAAPAPTSGGKTIGRRNSKRTNSELFAVNSSNRNFLNRYSSFFSDMSGDPSEKLRTLSISCLHEEDEEDMPVDDIYEDDEEDEDDEDVDNSKECHPVALGFVETPKHSWSLHRQLFPSIAGGTPGWLDPINLPNGRSCVCDFCGEPLQFLLQVYAPLSVKDSTFHRTIFIFMCTSMTCLLKDQHEQWKRNSETSSRSVKVFRCQLPRFNSFYSSEPPKGDGSDQPLTTGASLCSWCGTWRGDKVCSNCKRVRYCSKEHQAAHWRSVHKTYCQRSSLAEVISPSSSIGISAETQKAASNHLWPQFEIINEDECDYQQSMDNEFAKSLISQSQMDDTISSLVPVFEGDSDKKTWASFQERISRAPEQVLRYYSSAKAKPLWPISSGKPSKFDIPACCHCGGPRTCELQVLPQLLYYFGVKNEVDSLDLDWATIVVYTCEASCEGNIAYKEEFGWVQLASQSTTCL